MIIHEPFPALDRREGSFSRTLSAKYSWHWPVEEGEGMGGILILRATSG